jgi:ABC-2 type transport system ATP-binding protein
MSRLELDGLTRAYGSVTALDHLSFSVASGLVTGFLGPNGAGKTTAMRAVFGLTDLDTGAVRWNGAVVTMSDRRRFGYLPEERGLYPGMLAGEQLEYLGRLHGLSPAAAASAAAGWLDRLGVADHAGSKVESLSLGNQQRVQLASALVHNPDLLILDEPLSGLDPAGIDAVGEVLASEARAGKCVLFSSHQLDLVEDLCESVVIIDRDRGGAWARGLAGVTVSENDGGALRLVLAETGGADAQSVLRAAMAAGPVTEFAVRRRRLSEIFREAVSQQAGRRPAPAAGAARGAGVPR